MVAAFIQALVNDLDRTWRSHGQSEDDFAAIARECLARAEPSAALDGTALLSFAAAPRPEVRGHHVSPGVLPLYSGQSFGIFAHFWLDDFAVPHDHGWAGAFAVVEGRSVDGRHRFEPRDRTRAELALGRLRCDERMVREAGDTVAVTPGPGFIHSVQYLDRPGVAISVRTTSRKRDSTTYFRPGLALGEKATDDEVTCRLRALTLTRSIDEGRFVEQLCRLVGSGDRITTFLALSEAAQDGFVVPREVTLAGEQTHGESLEAILGAVNDVLLYQEVAELRAEHRDARTRALLAALYLCEEREELVRTLEALSFFGADGTSPWTEIGERLVALLVDDDSEAERPSFLPHAVGQVAAGTPAEALRDELRARATEEEPVRDDHLEFLESIRGVFAESTLYRALATG